MTRRVSNVYRTVALLTGALLLTPQAGHALVVTHPASDLPGAGQPALAPAPVGRFFDTVGEAAQAADAQAEQRQQLAQALLGFSTHSASADRCMTLREALAGYLQELGFTPSWQLNVQSGARHYEVWFGPDLNASVLLTSWMDGALMSMQTNLQLGPLDVGDAVALSGRPAR
ncbi:hypothetical protein [Deinococcus sonorensis]|uniref:Uncharacterized protein n=2 Tax=Deinococcus sonorensis TaxID=309891 RepID=A0AAU7U6E9_9DEIO